MLQVSWICVLGKRIVLENIGKRGVRGEVYGEQGILKTQKFVCIDQYQMLHVKTSGLRSTIIIKVASYNA